MAAAHPGSSAPIAALVLSVSGGCAVLFGSLVELGQFLMLSPLQRAVFVTSWLPGLVGLASGPAIVTFGALFFLQQRDGGIYGGMIIALALVSVVATFTQFFLGTLVATIGGVLALTWNPRRLFPTS